MTTANVFKRLQAAKVAVQGTRVRESGSNTFAKYTYLELGDFMPQINTACEANGICGVINFGDVATLTIINTDAPDDRIIFTSPMSTAELKGCHPVQNLGAVQTYLRRYLWMMAFDITDHDALDSTNGRDKVEPAKAKAPIVDTIDRAAAQGISNDLKNSNIPVIALFEEFGISRLGELKKTQLEEVDNWITMLTETEAIPAEDVLPDVPVTE